MIEDSTGRPIDGRKTPTNLFALWRTTLANDRTFLAYFRTANGLFASAVGLAKLVDHWLTEWAVPTLAFGGVACLVIGIFRYRRAAIHLQRYSHDYLGGVHLNEL